MQTLIDEFHDCFDRVEDARVQGRIIHPMNSILFLIVTAVIADCDGPEEIADFGRDRLDWLSQFADFSEGIPSHDTMAASWQSSKPEQFQTALLQWHEALCQRHAEMTGGSGSGELAKERCDRRENGSRFVHQCSKVRRNSYRVGLGDRTRHYSRPK